ncbi:MAG: type II toxin-antitoxin system VapC family toxin [Actinomycetota bacterium]|nr:type II toxin-antitoxin system VapC family toxin [Actinomycetota bacterium]
MITYVDTSTLLKLLIEEQGSVRAAVIWDSAAVVAAARVVHVEARAALAAAARGRRLSPVQLRRTKTELVGLWQQFTIVEITEGLVDLAGDLAEQERLRDYDAIHLAAALQIGADLLTSADSDLCAAATRRGLHVANPIDDDD